MMETAPTPTTRFSHPNKFIQAGLFDQLQEGLCHLKIRDVIRVAHQLGVLGQTVYDAQGNELHIEDIECAEGDHVLARESDLYYFWAGPELSETVRGHMYTTVSGTVLDWLIDNIMFQLSYNGWDVIEKLEIDV